MQRAKLTASVGRQLQQLHDMDMQGIQRVPWAQVAVSVHCSNPNRCRSSRAQQLESSFIKRILF
jgi:hypothetical protein